MSDSTTISPAKKGDLVAVRRVSSSTSIYSGMVRHEHWTIERAAACDRRGVVKKTINGNGTPRAKDRYTEIQTLRAVPNNLRENVEAIFASSEQFGSREELVAAIKGTAIA